MNTSREFHLGDILSAVTGRLVSKRHMDGVYAIFDYIEGYDHWTHELPAARRRCKPVLLAQMPWLNEITAPVDGWASEAEVWAWLDEQVVRYGEMHSIKPAPIERQMSPVDSLRLMLNELGNPARIITLDPDDMDGSP